MVNPYERSSLYGRINSQKLVDLEIPGYTSTGTRRIFAAVCSGKEKRFGISFTRLPGSRCHHLIKMMGFLLNDDKPLLEQWWLVYFFNTVHSLKNSAWKTRWFIFRLKRSCTKPSCQNSPWAPVQGQEGCHSRVVNDQQHGIRMKGTVNQ